MSEETETGKKRILLRSIYLWTALHVLLAAAVVMWTVDAPQHVAWIREYWIFFLISGILYGLLACYGYVTSKEMEGALFNFIWLLIPSALLATYVTFFQEAILWVPVFVLLGLTFCVPHPQRMKCYGCKDIDYNDPKEALRGCVACLAFPLFIGLYLVRIITELLIRILGCLFGDDPGN